MSDIRHEDHPADLFTFGCRRCFDLLLTVFERHASGAVAREARERVVSEVERIRDAAIAGMGSDPNKQAAAGGLNGLIRYLRRKQQEGGDA